MGLVRAVAVLCALWLGGCASSTAPGIDGAPPPPTADAAPPDAPPVPPPAAREARELVPGGGRMVGGSIVMDAQIGHAVGQTKMTGGTLSAEGAAVIKP
jgi:hypothetical protein